MKKQLLLAVALSTTAAMAQQTSLSGNIDGLAANTKVYLRDAMGENFMDSTNSSKGKFEINTKIPGPGIYSLQIGASGAGAENRLIYMAPGKLRISGAAGELADATLQGPAYAKDFSTFSKQLDLPLFDELEKLNLAYRDAYTKKDTVMRNEVLAKMRPLSAKADSVRTEIARNWVKKNPSSEINAFVLYMYLRRKMDNTALQTALNELPAAAKASVIAQKMQHSLDMAKKLQVGNPALDFTQNDPDGKPVSLRDFRGKYVLIDFWASWCGPCRAENPNVVAAYNKYKNKNFTILGISLDKDRAKWLEAVEKDGLTWPHVSDLQYWSNAVAKQYDVSAIPANYLIDPNGNIVAKNLRGEHLVKKLEELMVK
ncbi:MAG: redoxin domain-containing protein [Chitinophagaceae bacterium]